MLQTVAPGRLNVAVGWSGREDWDRLDPSRILMPHQVGWTRHVWSSGRLRWCRGVQVSQADNRAMFYMSWPQ